MKKILVLFLSLFCAFSMSACFIQDSSETVVEDEDLSPIDPDNVIINPTPIDPDSVIVIPEEVKSIDVTTTVGTLVRNIEIIEEDGKYDFFEVLIEEFVVEYTESAEYGALITEIEGLAKPGVCQWISFYVNDESSQVGVSSYEPTNGDEIEFKLEDSTWGDCAPLPDNSDFITDFGDLNVYDLSYYHSVAEGDTVTLQLKLEEKSPGAQWGTEVRFSDSEGVLSTDMAEEIFGSSINRLFFSFNNNVADRMEIGGVYLIELQKDTFPPNSRPQFGIEGMPATGDETINLDGKFCKVTELHACDKLDNNDHTVQENISNVIDTYDGGEHTVHAYVKHNIGNFEGNSGFGDNSGFIYTWAENTGNVFIGDLDETKMYELKVSGIQKTGDNGGGDYTDAMNIISAKEIDFPEEDSPEDEVSDFTCFADLVVGEEALFRFKVISYGTWGAAVLEDMCGVLSTEAGFNGYPLGATPDNFVVDGVFEALTTKSSAPQLSFNGGITQIV